MRSAILTRLRLLGLMLALGGFLLIATLCLQVAVSGDRPKSGTAVGIHLGGSGWQSAWMNRIRGNQPGGCWPEVAVLLSGNVYTKHRLIGLNPVASQEAYSHTKGILPGLADQIERTCHFC